MKVLDCLSKNQATLSIEIEPPKLGSDCEDIFSMLDPLVEEGIRYIDITYHSPRFVEEVESNGSSSPLYQRLKPGTLGIATSILNRYQSKGVFPVPHVICSGFSKYDNEDFLHGLHCAGIHNVLALRGDGRKNKYGEIEPFVSAPGGHSHAKELVRQIADLNKGKFCSGKDGSPMDFGIGAACYPELSPDHSNTAQEMIWLKEKVDAGVDYLVTQMFFSAKTYETFRELCEQAKIYVPIIPGIKPLSTYHHVDTLPSIFYCDIPDTLKKKVVAHKDCNESIKKIGIEWCIEQCEALLKLGAPSLHFYAARQAPILEIVKEFSGKLYSKEL